MYMLPSMFLEVYELQRMDEVNSTLSNCELCLRRKGKSTFSSEIRMGKPHAIVVPFPALGHILPLMEPSHRLIDRDFRVTFVCTESDHERMVTALQEEAQDSVDGICLVTVPYGMKLEDNQSESGGSFSSILAVFEEPLENIIRKINERAEDEISCLVADLTVTTAFSVAKKMGVPRFGFTPASLGCLAQCLHIPKLIESGIVDYNGATHLQNQTVQLSPAMPEMSTSTFLWNGCSNPTMKKAMFQHSLLLNQTVSLVDWILCNTFRGIEAPALDLIPQALPIGPLLSNNRLTKPVGHFWPEDLSCLGWLDQQQDRSVIYVAFGSLAVFSQTQLQELATGIELTGRPFLWVVRPNLVHGSTVVYPEDFLARLADRGKIVSWAPQQKVLAHRAVACFMSHCGWNSTLEGLSNGVSFLCWPCLVDQFLNKEYICDVWKIGFELKVDENGIVTRKEIQGKVENLLNDKGIRTRSLRLKEMAKESVGGGGASLKNLDDFVDGIKQSLKSSK